MPPSFPFPLRLPVCAAPMFLISGPDLVVAACEAGIVGAFPTPNARPIEVLEAWMDEITRRLATIRAQRPDALIGQMAQFFVKGAQFDQLLGNLVLVPALAGLFRRGG